MLNKQSLDSLCGALAYLMEIAALTDWIWRKT